MKKLLFLTAVLLVTSSYRSLAQNEYGEIKGRLTDSISHEPIPFATVVALLNDNMISGASTDVDGYFSIKPLSSGHYTVKTSMLGYKNVQINNVSVNSGKMSYLSIGISPSAIEIIGGTIYDYKNPLIDPGQVSTMQILETADIENAPYMDVKQTAAITAGVYQEDEGESIYMRGAREDGTAYYIDGIRVIGDFRLPKASVKEMKVLTGGIPASIGDVSGGVIMITTKGFGNW